MLAFAGPCVLLESFVPLEEFTCKGSKGNTIGRHLGRAVTVVFVSLAFVAFVAFTAFMVAIEVGFVMDVLVPSIMPAKKWASFSYTWTSVNVISLESSMMAPPAPPLTVFP